VSDAVAGRDPSDRETLSVSTPPSYGEGAVQDQHPVAERNNASVRRFIEEVQNQENWDAETS
jgi:hypothetical protein